jgi:hypothetical protein
MNIPIDDGVRAALLEALRTPALPMAEAAAESAGAPEPEAASFESVAAASASDPGETLLALDVWHGAATRRLHCTDTLPATTADALAAHVMQALG